MSVKSPVKKPQKNRAVGRARTNFPDPSKDEGQWAMWLQYHLPPGVTGEDLAEGVGKSRSMGFDWLAGKRFAPPNIWSEISKWLGIGNHWTDLSPPAEFVRYIKRYGRLPSDDRYKRTSE